MASPRPCTAGSTTYPLLREIDVALLCLLPLLPPHPPPSSYGHCIKAEVQPPTQQHVGAYEFGHCRVLMLATYLPQSGMQVHKLLQTFTISPSCCTCRRCETELRGKHQCDMSQQDAYEHALQATTEAWLNCRRKSNPHDSAALQLIAQHNMRLQLAPFLCPVPVISPPSTDWSCSPCVWGNV